MALEQGDMCTTLQSQKAVSAYSASKQILPFDFAWWFSTRGYCKEINYQVADTFRVYLNNRI